MINLPKRELVDMLSLIDGVVFVGGTSEYLQGIKNTLRDIDIVVPINTDLSDFGWVFRKTDNQCVLLSAERGIIITQECVIDIFFTDKVINTIDINGYKCQIIKDMIKIQKGVLEFGYYKTETHRLKAVTTFNRLINHL
jgi:hypothetical protein